MATGWNQIDKHTADVINNLDESCIIETNIVNKLILDSVKEKRITIGDVEDQNVVFITGTTPRGGRHEFIYWRDPKITDPDGDVMDVDWDHAVLAKRFHKKRGEWINNSDNLTSVEVIERRTKYNVSATVYGGGLVSKSDADSMEEARDIVEGEADAGSFEIVTDANPETEVTEFDDRWEVTLSAVGGCDVYALSPKEAIEKASRRLKGQSGEFHSLYIDILKDKETGEQWNDVTLEDFE